MIIKTSPCLDSVIIYIYIFEILENYLSKQLVEVIVAPFEKNVSYTRNVFDK